MHREGISVFKRLMDIVISLALLIVVIPIMVIIAIAIRISSGPPILFKQERLGLNAQPFQLLKFRTMVPNARYIGSGVQVTENDPRITRVGRFLRRWSLDELPQLFNILKGDMSLVGPRPVLPDHPKPLHEYTDRELKRFLVRPGLTGLAQINGRGNTTWDKKFEYDIKYVENRNVWLDLLILLKTAILLVKGSDIYLTDPLRGRE